MSDAPNSRPTLPSMPVPTTPWKWAFLGTILGFFAPLGFWLVIKIAEPQSREALVSWVYGYTAITSCFVFALAGVSASRMVQRLREAGTHDSLTGLPNRRLFIEQLPSLFANRARRGETLSLLMLDLDHFKRVNDDYSHSIGDQTLIAVAQTLEADVRKGDLIARYGGEEFVVALPNTDEEAGLLVAERIRESISSLADDRLGFEGVQTVSIGLTCTAMASDTPHLVLRRADKALYEAKSSGRDRVCIYRNESVRPEDSSR